MAAVRFAARIFPLPYTTPFAIKFFLNGRTVTRIVGAYVE
jgi:hypothetical protein